MLYSVCYEDGGVFMPASEAHKQATRKYLASLGEIRLRVSKEEKEAISEHAKARGESVNGFVQRAVRETMDRDKK